MKRFTALLLSCMILLTLIQVPISVKANGNNDGLYSQENYDDFELEWANYGERDILLSVTNSYGKVVYSYDGNYFLQAKVGMDGRVTTFEYDEEGKIISVREEGHILIYMYDEFQNLTSVSIDGIAYQCELDDLSVKTLRNQDNEIVAEYIYKDGKVAEVRGIDINGKMVDMSEDADFIGNLNKVTYCSYYYDEDTGWYYCGRFYDVKANRYIDGLNMSFEEFQMRGLYFEQAQTVSGLKESFYQWVLNSSGYGTPIDDYSSTWYASLDVFEIMIRLIYGEAPNTSDDRRAVAWVLWNRRMLGYKRDTYGDASFEGVMLAEDQFKVITGSEDETVAARKPATASERWKNSAEYASAMWAAVTLQGGESQIGTVLSIPQGYYSQQKEFRSYGKFWKREINGGKKEDNARDINGVPYFLNERIYHICIPGIGEYETVGEAKAAYEANYSSGEVNIYFSWEPFRTYEEY